MDEAVQRDLIASLERIEVKLGMLLLALVDDEDDESPDLTLDGEPTGGARDEGTPL